ncbi:hypothetical protein SAMN05421820_103124 [Pedobacter steynii]|uniref:Uncharacterized protein n=2 Tax=Pedobacter steynii TaxID=430522 RepID=A0A1G9R4U8_9SPHI|nr:hypothetical protein [Pedobacter steynii]SDM18258.1 hypothetical protein SAMN05421820_103124 [Pedobacter steynii]
MSVLSFTFFKMLEGIRINNTLRVSIWPETNESYLMPSRFIEVRENNDFFIVKIEILDPDKFIGARHLEEKFFFGHPGKIIGYGFLNEIVENDSRKII